MRKKYKVTYECNGNLTAAAILTGRVTAEERDKLREFARKNGVRISHVVSLILSAGISRL